MSSEQRLVVVSNRLPPLRAPANEAERRMAPVGGLVTALHAAVENREGLWFGWSGRTRRREEPTGPRLLKVGHTQMASMDLSIEDVELFYNEFCNRSLWPLLHSFPAKTIIRRDTYNAYLRTNREYAQALSGLLAPDDVIWVHDYHLIPLGHELRSLGWKGKVGFFLHTPFPPSEVFTVLPWARVLLDMLLDYDLVGLHTRRYVNNLLDSLSYELPGYILGDRFTDGQRFLETDVYPIGIDPEAFQDMVAGLDGNKSSVFEDMPADHKLVLGVDRLDYTKGIVQRLLTFEQLLEDHPEVRGKVSMIQISAPSRRDVPEYVEERQQVDHLVGRINGQYSDPDWVPIRYLYRSFPQFELAAFYHSADVCLVTPLRDGMNLVAKEFVASQNEDDPGVVLLSKFCGAAYTMKDAVIVNPYDIEGTAEALSQALNMSREERQRRWSALMEDIRAYTAQRWIESFLGDLVSQ